MSKKQKLILITVVLFVGAAFLLFPKLKYAYAAFQKSSNQKVISIYLSNRGGALNIEKISALLYDKGVISSKDLFELVGEYKEMNQRNIAPGKYVIEPGTAYRHIWNGFTINGKLNGNVEQSVQVSFENFRTLNDLAGKLQKQLDLDST